MTTETLTTCDICEKTHLREAGHIKPPEDWAELELYIATPHEWKRQEGYWILCPACIVKVGNFLAGIKEE